MHSLFCDDCFQVLPTIAIQSVDLIIADIPYSTTDCKWDNELPLDELWELYRRVIQPRGVIIFTASQPFTTALINSNPAWFRYMWVWVKTRANNFANAKKMPLKRHEDILVFYNQQPTYNPQNLRRIDKKRRTSKNRGGDVMNTNTFKAEYIQEYTDYPDSILYFDREIDTVHPTQKPVELMEYLITTYTNHGDTVLDSCMGSGSVGVACIQTGRTFIGIEKDARFFGIADQRIRSTEVRRDSFGI
jgi:site-specific DNA-methyltransferase (adenine-specific)